MKEQLELINTIAKCIGDEIDYSVKYSNPQYLLSKFNLIYCYSSSQVHGKSLKIDLDTFNNTPYYYAKRQHISETVFVMNSYRASVITLESLNSSHVTKAAVLNMFILHANKLTDIMREFTGDIFLEIGPKEL